MDFHELALNTNVDSKEFKDAVYAKRLELIDIAIQWPGETTKETMIFNNVWEYPSNSSYTVCLGKYGKEFYESGQTGNGQKNSNDMRPTVLKDGCIVDSVRGRFDDIFRLMELCHSKENGQELLKAFAILFYRNALLLDHQIVARHYLYEPPQSLIDVICASLPSYEGIPMEVYIHFLDAIGLNEDVKYFTQQKLQNGKGIGRENNMKTYAHDACCLLGHVSWADFIYKLIRNFGVSPISNKDMATFFPELSITYRVPRQRTRRSASTTTVIKEILDQHK